MGMYDMSVMDEMCILLACALGFDDLTEGKDLRGDFVSEWERGKRSCFDGFRYRMPFTPGTPMSFAKNVVQMHLHDAIGATHYMCYEDIRAVSFNFPEHNGANNCVIAECEPKEGRPKPDRLTFIIEFSNVRMLDSRHVDRNSVKVLAQYRTELDGIIPAFEEFTGLKIPRCKDVGDWNPAYRDFGMCWRRAGSDDRAQRRFWDMCDALRTQYKNMFWQLYPAPGFTIEDEQRKLDAIEEKKRKQLAHIEAITGRA